MKAKSSSQQITREYFDSLLVEMRTIDAVEGSTKTTVFGTEISTPVMVAALSYLHEVCPDGMVETAKGAAAAGTVMWSGIGPEDELEQLIAAGAKVIKIVKPYSDKDLIFRKIEHAEKAGALAVGMDTDYVFGRIHNKYSAKGFPVSPKTLDDIKSFVKATKLPFIIKGVLSEQDAAKALDAGAGGIVVSHHNGVFDCAIPPLKILPRIKKLVGGTIPIFVDCGIQSGMDAFKALALGASGVCVGTKVIAGLSRDGAAGVRKVLEEITAELNWAMNITGSPDLAHIDPSVIWT
ncbi:MAG: alpha-hydroxy-acid oxidizing protein [Bacteroidales bacterium]|jgi:isopentenyl diphosphate isomerase/L-lactate dehydrogenase-like FMN-dependent dehydrogenase|nr:alpha-hydroxy-acid oxidizing protein [Bacteroidales bacterium]